MDLIPIPNEVIKLLKYNMPMVKPHLYYNHSHDKLVHKYIVSLSYYGSAKIPVIS